MAPKKKRQHVAPLEKKRGVDYDAPPGCVFYAKISAPDFSKSGTKIFFPFRSLMIPYL